MKRMYFPERRLKRRQEAEARQAGVKLENTKRRRLEKLKKEPPK